MNQEFTDERMLAAARQFMATVTQKIMPSAVRGKVAEGLIAGALGPHMQTVKMTAGHSGDMVATYRGVSIMIESKWYSRPVGGAEVEKFIRDVGEMPVDGAVMVSVGQPVTGRSHLEVAGNPPIMFCHVAGELVPDLSNAAEPGPAALVFSDYQSQTVIGAVKALAEIVLRSRRNIAADIAVDQLSDAISAVAKSREKTSAAAGEMAHCLAKVSAEIAGAERQLRLIATPAPEPAEWTSHPLWSKVPNSYKVAAEAVCVRLAARWPALMSAKKIGFGDWFVELTAAPTVGVPRGITSDVPAGALKSMTASHCVFCVDSELLDGFLSLI